MCVTSPVDNNLILCIKCMQTCSEQSELVDNSDKLYQHSRD